MQSVKYGKKYLYFIQNNASKLYVTGGGANRSNISRYKESWFAPACVLKFTPVMAYQAYNYAF